MYHVSAQGVDERMRNVHYYCKKQILVTGKAWLQVSRICRAVECVSVGKRRIRVTEKA